MASVSTHEEPGSSRRADEGWRAAWEPKSSTQQELFFLHREDEPLPQKLCVRRRPEKLTSGSAEKSICRCGLEWLELELLYSHLETGWFLLCLHVFNWGVLLVFFFTYFCMFQSIYIKYVFITEINNEPYLVVYRGKSSRSAWLYCKF